jgi:hypothetical protein
MVIVEVLPMPKGVYVPIYTCEREALIKFAMKEDRDPRVQAARFIREGLKAAGALDEEQARTAIEAAS